MPFVHTSDEAGVELPVQSTARRAKIVGYIEVWLTLQEVNIWTGEVSVVAALGSACG